MIETQTEFTSDDLLLMRKIGTGYSYRLFTDNHITYHVYLMHLKSILSSQNQHTIEQPHNTATIELRAITSDQLDLAVGYTDKFLNPEQIPELFASETG